MLGWFAGVSDENGARSTNVNFPLQPALPDEPAPDESEERFDDAPTTPAPVFAARAFKHMIWGTPEAEEAEKKREQPRRRTSRSLTTSVSQEIPKASEKIDVKTAQYGSLSPAKRPGILVTPGTGGTRRKTVSFERKPLSLNFGVALANMPAPTPREIPGKFPTPGDKANKPLEEKASKPTTNRSLARSCKDVVPATNIQSRDSGRPKPAAEDITLDMTAPRSTSGVYWKTEYDSYSSTSTLEMRKLAKKEQMAKKYAKHRDEEAMQLSEALRREQKRVLELERKVADYIGQLASAVKHGANPGSVPKDGNEALERQDLRGVLHCDTNAAPRSDLRKLESSLTNARAENEILQQSNDSLQSKVTRMECHMHEADERFARLLEENEVLRTRVSHGRREKHILPDPNIKADLGSDIWADVGNDDEADSGRTKHPISRHTRSPLRRRDVNRGDDAEGSRSTKAKGLTDERREAARKRLEERRRAREAV